MDKTGKDNFLMDKEQISRIDDAAQVIAAGWSDTGEMSLRGAIQECFVHSPGAGTQAYKRWIASLESLGELCISIAKREKGLAE